MNNNNNIDRSNFSLERSGIPFITMSATSMGNNMENIQGIAKSTANYTPLNGSIENSEE